MNLAIDIGNSRVKVALFKQGQLVAKTILESFSPAQVEKFWSDYGNPERAIVSNVGEETKLPVRWNFPSLILDSQTALPFQSEYKTPQTIGKDRLALAAAARFQYPAQDCLVIDAGTCITYDFVNRSGNYLGGGISPGLKMRLQSLPHFTSRLPLVEAKPHFELIGQSTENSILSGTVGGIIREVEGTIAEYKSRYPQLVSIVTGGDMLWFDDLLKNSIFAAPDFLMMGLNYILDYNAERL